ncbi:putative GNAT superfamily acetyltransferase [Scopulibacillus daqui]|uniref:GNAT superfamily acetyltransferase n=1 Tax=Scopulibacillus daqui TaxID=1469162 RepID=A0ABS2Q3C3_9BACL|nr:GNAT family N-acetyltransferase [Scopulibacillus daqui]MBM7646797.1 putative GNAT superfamily acetyltransferase [Scopulibacillus daqui]
MTSITIKELQSLEELKELAILEEKVWGTPPLPTHQTLTVAKNGGIILGAYDNEKMVGFNYGFPGFSNQQVYLCSHMTGIHPDFQKKGIGFSLKKKQQTVALDRGYNLITWTFDPLESLNAYLNLSKCRGIAADYTEHLYGDMDDALNGSLPSDRFRVEWRINSGHVNNDFTIEEKYAKDIPSLVNIKGNQPLPCLDDVENSMLESIEEKDTWLVPVPAKFQEIKKSDLDLALDWRLKTRKIFKALLSKGFVGVQVIKHLDHQSIHHYIFVKKQLLDL